MDSSVTIVNCTLSRNSSTELGGALSNTGSDATVTNCISWGNTAGGAGPEIHSDAASVTTVTYSDVGQDGYADGGNINADPLFVDADGPDNVAGTSDDDLRAAERHAQHRLAPCVPACVRQEVLDLVREDVPADHEPLFLAPGGIVTTKCWRRTFRTE